MTWAIVGASAVAPIVSVVMAVIATGPGVGVGNRTRGGSTGLDRSESESHHNGKQRGGDYQSEEFFHVGDFLCF